MKKSIFVQFPVQILCLACIISILASGIPLMIGNAAPESWRATQSLDQARENHTATLLSDGRLLIAGGDDGDDIYYSHAEIYDPTRGSWITTDSMNYTRAGHTATMLTDGRVLVTGGYGMLNGSVGLPIYLDTAEIFDPATGEWTLAGTMITPRVSHTATLLNDGTVLLTGGRTSDLNYTASAEIYSPATDTFALTGSMTGARRDHTATLLKNGQVLIVGGYSGSNSYLSSVQLYDPETGEFSSKANITTSRSRHTATLLHNGMVLVTGGRSYQPLPSPGYVIYRDDAYTYNPATNQWAAASPMSDKRSDHSASLLPDGRVIVVGGTNSSALSGCEIYNPIAGSWSTANALNNARYRHTATLLADGYILAVGGFNSSATLSSAELFEPPTSSWNDTNNLIEGRRYHIAVLLEDGNVLVAGGYGEAQSDVLDSVELFNPVTGVFTATATMNEPRYRHTATLLVNGKVLVTGGNNPTSSYLNTAEIYDPQSGIWNATGTMADRRESHTATLLPDGKVLVTGGFYYDGVNSHVLDSTAIYDPFDSAWSAAASMHNARVSHTATLLPDGKVLVTGGNNLDGFPLPCEIYDPETDQWTVVDSLNQGRRYHTATLLPNGKVIVIGGNYGGNTYISTPEIYNPAADTWTNAAATTLEFAYHTATLLPDGRVLVTGGYNDYPEYFLEQALIYDPATGTWSALPDMNNDRGSHTATLLPDGRVVIIGGSGGAAFIKDTAEIVTNGLDFNVNWRPVVDNYSSPIKPGDDIVVTGSQFRGDSEASGGGTQNSSSGYPLVQLRRLDNEQLYWFQPDTNLAYSDTEFYSTLDEEFPYGPALLTMFTNGIPSESKFVQIRLEYRVYLPVLIK